MTDLNNWQSNIHSMELKQKNEFPCVFAKCEDFEEYFEGVWMEFDSLDSINNNIVNMKAILQQEKEHFDNEVLYEQVIPNRSVKEAGGRSIVNKYMRCLRSFEKSRLLDSMKRKFLEDL